MSTLNAMIFKARRTLCNHLEERGYDVSSYNNFNLNDISILQSKDDLDMEVNNEEGHTIRVLFSLNKTLRVKNISELIEDEYETNLKPDDDLIFIVKDSMNQTMKDYIKNLYYSEKQFVTLFHLPVLQFNILEHNFVPKHIVLSTEQKESVYKQYNIQDDGMLPEISRFDPVAMVIGLRPSQLCRIVRTSKTAIQSDYYRICV